MKFFLPLFIVVFAFASINARTIQSTDQSVEYSGVIENIQSRLECIRRSLGEISQEHPVLQTLVENVRNIGENLRAEVRQCKENQGGFKCLVEAGREAWGQLEEAKQQFFEESKELRHIVNAAVRKCLEGDSEPPTDEDVPEPPTDEDVSKPPTTEVTSELPTEEVTSELPTEEDTSEPPSDEDDRSIVALHHTPEQLECIRNSLEQISKEHPVLQNLVESVRNIVANFRAQVRQCKESHGGFKCYVEAGREAWGQWQRTKQQFVEDSVELRDIVNEAVQNCLAGDSFEVYYTQEQLECIKSALEQISNKYPVLQNLVESVRNISTNFRAQVRQCKESHGGFKCYVDAGREAWNEFQQTKQQFVEESSELRDLVNAAVQICLAGDSVSQYDEDDRSFEVYYTQEQLECIRNSLQQISNEHPVLQSLVESVRNIVSNFREQLRQCKENHGGFQCYVEAGREAWSQWQETMQNFVKESTELRDIVNRAVQKCLEGDSVSQSDEDDRSFEVYYTQEQLECIKNSLEQISNEHPVLQSLVESVRNIVSNFREQVRQCKENHGGFKCYVEAGREAWSQWQQVKEQFVEESSELRDIVNRAVHKCLDGDSEPEFDEDNRLFGMSNVQNILECIKSRLNQISHDHPVLENLANSVRSIIADLRAQGSQCKENQKGPICYVEAGRAALKKLQQVTERFVEESTELRGVINDAIRSCIETESDTVESYNYVDEKLDCIRTSLSEISSEYPLVQNLANDLRAILAQLLAEKGRCKDNNEGPKCITDARRAAWNQWNQRLVEESREVGELVGSAVSKCLH